MRVEIREAQAEEYDAVLDVVGAAFGDERSPALVRALDASGHTQASIVAVEAGEVLGHVQLTRSWVDARERLVEVLTLSPLSVLPARQGAGIGTLLVASAIARAGELGAPALFLEGSPAYYGARGFSRASTSGFERPSVRVPDPGFQVVVLPAHEPWMTGRFVYCEAFWAQDCVGLRDPELADVERRIG